MPFSFKVPVEQVAMYEKELNKKISRILHSAASLIGVAMGLFVLPLFLERAGDSEKMHEIISLFRLLAGGLALYGFSLFFIFLTNKSRLLFFHGIMSWIIFPGFLIWAGFQIFHTLLS